jgi:hypothetical protein
MTCRRVTKVPAQLHEVPDIRICTCTHDICLYAISDLVQFYAESKNE